MASLGVPRIQLVIDEQEIKFTSCEVKKIPTRYYRHLAVYYPSLFEVNYTTEIGEQRRARTYWPITLTREGDIETFHITTEQAAGPYRVGGIVYHTEGWER